jgi:hypothetical protein
MEEQTQTEDPEAGTLMDLIRRGALTPEKIEEIQKKRDRRRLEMEIAVQRMNEYIRFGKIFTQELPEEE